MASGRDWEAGMESDKGCVCTDEDCELDDATGEVKGTGDGGAVDDFLPSSDGSGVKPGGRAGDDATESPLSRVVKRVVDWLIEESAAGSDAAVGSGGGRPSDVTSRSTAW